MTKPHSIEFHIEYADAARSVMRQKHSAAAAEVQDLSQDIKTRK